MERKDQIERINQKLSEIMQYKEKFYFKAEKRKQIGNRLDNSFYGHIYTDKGEKLPIVTSAGSEKK